MKPEIIYQMKLLIFEYFYGDSTISRWATVQIYTHVSCCAIRYRVLQHSLLIIKITSIDIKFSIFFCSLVVHVISNDVCVVLYLTLLDPFMRPVLRSILSTLANLYLGECYIYCPAEIINWIDRYPDEFSIQVTVYHHYETCVAVNAID